MRNMADKNDSGFWHVIISTEKNSRKGDTVVLDKSREWVEDRVLEPRRRGESISLSGRTFKWDDIERVRITVSSKSSDALIEEVRAKDRASSIAVLGGPSYQWRAAVRAEDVTDELISAPPGASNETGAATSRIDLRRVMVVHGRDEEARRATFDFLRAIGLNPAEWRKLVAETGKGSPYIGEVLEQAFEGAAAVLVLLTPDDQAKLRDDFVGEKDPEYERALTGQARPNVLFEAGMAFGLHPDRTVLVELGELRPFSDVVGRHVVRLNGTEGPLREIVSRLAAAGCAVDDSGDDWADPGRFPTR
jgi:predicted nucleotide-binding protein